MSGRYICSACEEAIATGGHRYGHDCTCKEGK